MNIIHKTSTFVRVLEGVKPDSILADWTSDREGKKLVTDVALGDFDIACKLTEGQCYVASPSKTDRHFGNGIGHLRFGASGESY